MRDEVVEKTVAILAAQALCAPEDLTPETRLADLGIDSLGMAEILFAIEEAFDVAMPFTPPPADGGGPGLGSVGSVCQAVAALVAASRG